MGCSIEVCFGVQFKRKSLSLVRRFWVGKGLVHFRAAVCNRPPYPIWCLDLRGAHFDIFDITHEGALFRLLDLLASRLGWT